jgi:hypothetical protein
MIKYRRMGWAGHVADIGKDKYVYMGFCWESQMERDG